MTSGVSVKLAPWQGFTETALVTVSLLDCYNQYLKQYVRSTTSARSCYSKQQQIPSLSERARSLPLPRGRGLRVVVAARAIVCGEIILGRSFPGLGRLAGYLLGRWVHFPLRPGAGTGMGGQAWAEGGSLSHEPVPIDHIACPLQFLPQPPLPVVKIERNVNDAVEVGGRLDITFH